MTVLLILGLLDSFIALAGVVIKRPMFNRALTACSILFLLSLVSKEVLYHYLSIKALLNNDLAFVKSFFYSSNHFIISLDIIFFFSAMMLILYHTFKIQKISPKR